MKLGLRWTHAPVVLPSSGGQLSKEYNNRDYKNIEIRHPWY